MKLFAFDFETALIRPGLQAPPVVCMSTCTTGHDGRLYDTAHILDPLYAALTDPETVLIGHNVAYDTVCALEWLDLWPELRAAYEAGRILDTMVIERLAEIAGLTTRKVLSLDVCGRAHGLPALDKDSGVRLDYGRFLHRPLSEYPQAHIDYAVEDAVNTFKLFDRQAQRYFKKVHLTDVAFMCRKLFWLQITRNRGLRTDPKQLAQLEWETNAFVTELQDFAKWAGFVRDDGSKNMKAIKAAVTEAYDGNPPMTKPQKGRKSTKPFVPQVSTARATLQESGDHVLEIFADYGEWSAVKNKDLPMLLAGVHTPIHTKWGIADTTRVTSAKPNVQNIRRKEGIRECFIPREGFCFLSADHGGLELSTLAQVIVTNLGRRDMADKINRGEDLHCHVGAEMLHITYAEAMARKAENEPVLMNGRNCGKVVNFGRPGGMGAKTLRLYAKQSYGLDFTIGFASELIQIWNRANPDGCAFLEWVGRLPKDSRGRYELQIPGSTIVRANATYCAACNSRFQGLGAILEAHVGWIIGCETLDPASPLGCCRLVNFVHDEFILECPIGRQTEAGARLGQIMREAAQPYLPDVKIEAEAVAMARWSKKAKRIEKDGELQIWGMAA